MSEHAEVVQATVVPNKGGRPTKINDIVPGGNLTIAEFIVEKTRMLWLPWVDIAAMAGVNRGTVRDWRRQGVRARSKAALGHKITREEDELGRFSTDLEAAEIEGMALRLGIIHDCAKGGQTITRTTTKSDADGNVIETTTVTETARPMWQAAAWQLERRMPERFALGPTRVEITGRGGGAIRIEGDTPDDRARGLAESLRAYQAGIEAAQALEADRATPAESNGATPE